MLIFTGYKLCRPKVWKHVAHIGFEQIAIFTITVVATGFVTGTDSPRELDEQYSRPTPVEEVPAYRGFDPSNLDIPAFLRRQAD